MAIKAHKHIESDISVCVGVDDRRLEAAYAWRHSSSSGAACCPHGQDLSWPSATHSLCWSQGSVDGTCRQMVRRGVVTSRQRWISSCCLGVPSRATSYRCEPSFCRHIPNMHRYGGARLCKCHLYSASHPSSCLTRVKHDEHRGMPSQHCMCLHTV